MTKALIVGALILSALLAVRTAVPHRPMPVPDDPFTVTRDDTSPLHLHFKAMERDGLPPDAPRQ